MTIRGHQLGIDWSRQGTYANAKEDISTPGTGYVSNDPILIRFGRNEARATEDAIVGELSASINNIGKVFSPENASSPIAGKVLPGTPVRYTVTDPATGSIRTLFSGAIDDFTAEPESTLFTFSALDAWGAPGAEQLSTPVYAGQRTGYLIGVILDAIGWTGPRDLDPGATVVDWWWSEGDDAATAVQKLVESEGPPAIAYVDGGTFVFRDRFHRLLDANSLTSQGTFTHIQPTGTGPAGDFKILKGSFSYNHGLKYLANSVTLQVDQRVPGVTTQVWSTDTPITLAANQTLQLIADSADPFINAVAPDPNATEPDYVLSTGTLLSTSLSRDSGQTTIITLVNDATPAVLIDGLRLRATPLSVARSVKVTAEDTASVSAYRRQTWSGTAPWANVYDAQAIANRVVAVYAQPRPTVTFTIASVNAATLTKILTLRISDRITVRNDVMGMNRDFYVESVAYEITRLGQLVKLTLGCQVVEPVRGSNEFTFDVAGKGFDQGVFAIEGLDVAGSLFQFDVAGRGFDQGRFGN